MCRIMAWSNNKIPGEVFTGLQKSFGGEGDGFLLPEKTVIKVSGYSETKSQKKNGFVIHRFLPEEKIIERKTKNKLTGKISIRFITQNQYINYNINSNFGFYHTRLVSTGFKALRKTHPAVFGNWAVFQNGTESDFMDKTNQIFNTDLADYESFAYSLKEGFITPKAFNVFSHSNFFIIDMKRKKFWIVSNKKHDPLLLYYNSNNDFIAVSEEIEIDKEFKELYYFLGMIEGKITEKGLEIKKKIISKEEFYYIPEIKNWYDQDEKYNFEDDHFLDYLREQEKNKKGLL